MTIINQKHQIVESLESLDYFQRAKVLEFIRGLLHPTRETDRHQRLKREAIKEIRQALGNGRKLNSGY